MQWFSYVLDVFAPAIMEKIYDIDIFMNQNIRCLHKTCSDR